MVGLLLRSVPKKFTISSTWLNHSAMKQGAQNAAAKICNMTTANFSIQIVESPVVVYEVE